MRRHSRAWIGVLSVWIGLHATAVPAAEAPRMAKDELRDRLGSPDVIVIDVRGDSDWALSGEKITGAVREDYQDFEDWSTRYPRDKTLVLYCA